MFKYAELKALIYLCLGVGGVLFVILAVRYLVISQGLLNPFSYMVSAVVLTIVGIACILFSLETIYFKDDPDVWR